MHIDIDHCEELEDWLASTSTPFLGCLAFRNKARSTNSAQPHYRTGLSYLKRTRKGIHRFDLYWRDDQVKLSAIRSAFYVERWFAAYVKLISSRRGVIKADSFSWSWKTDAFVEITDEVSDSDFRDIQLAVLAEAL